MEENCFYFHLNSILLFKPVLLHCRAIKPWVEGDINANHWLSGPQIKFYINFKTLAADLYPYTRHMRFLEGLVSLGNPHSREL